MPCTRYWSPLRTILPESGSRPRSRNLAIAKNPGVSILFSYPSVQHEPFGSCRIQCSSRQDREQILAPLGLNLCLDSEQKCSSWIWNVVQYQVAVTSFDHYLGCRFPVNSADFWLCSRKFCGKADRGRLAGQCREFKTYRKSTAQVMVGASLCAFKRDGIGSELLISSRHGIIRLESDLSPSLSLSLCMQSAKGFFR